MVAGEKDIVIRGGKIVRITKKPWQPRFPSPSTTIIAPTALASGLNNTASSVFFLMHCLWGKLFDLHDFIYYRPIDPFVYGAVETWLYAPVPDVSLKCFDALHMALWLANTWWWCFIAIVNNIFHIIDYKHVPLSAIQVLYADVECKQNIAAPKVVRFVCVYHPPNSDETSSLLFLETLKTQIDPFNKGKLSIIMGDFILQSLVWTECYYKSYSCWC